MSDTEKENLLTALKTLDKKQFDQLKQQLKDFIPAIEADKRPSKDQTKLKKLFEAQEKLNQDRKKAKQAALPDDVYNANPFLFILRTGTSGYEQKDTDSFVTVRNKILGTPLTDALKKVGTFMPWKSKKPQENAEVTRQNGIYDSL